MNGTEMVRSALMSAGKTQTELADFMGWSKQNLSGRLKNNSLSFDELTKALGFCGYEVKLVDMIGRELPDIGNSASPHVVQMVNGITYDTKKAESICDTKAVDGNECYMELFRDTSGLFFAVHYQLMEGGVNMVTPVPDIVAEQYRKRYGK